MLRLLLALALAAVPAGAESLRLLADWPRLLEFMRARPALGFSVDARGVLHRHGEALPMHTAETLAHFVARLPEGPAREKRLADALNSYLNGNAAERNTRWELALFETDPRSEYRLTPAGLILLFDILTARDGVMLRQTDYFKQRLAKFWKPQRTPQGAISLGPDFDNEFGGNHDAADLTGMEIDAMIASGMDGRGVTIGVVDTGIDKDHPWFKGRLATYLDFTGAGAEDASGHGTHVAGIAATVAPRSRIASFKIIHDENDYGSDRRVQRRLDDRILAAMQAATRLPPEKRPEVINLSLGAQYRRPVYDHINQLANGLMIKHNILVIAAAGNNGDGKRSSLDSPGDAEYVLSVTGLNGFGNFSDTPGRGPVKEEPETKSGFEYNKPDLTTVMGSNARQVISAAPGGGTAGMVGTSQAAPFAAVAANVIGYLIDHEVPYRATEVKAAMLETTRDLGWSREIQGAGQMNARRLAERVIERVKLGVPVGNIAAMLALRITEDQKRAIEASDTHAVTPLGIIELRTGRLLNTDKALRRLQNEVPPRPAPALPRGLGIPAR